MQQNVTNAHFEAFTQDGSYQKAQYWEEAIKDNQWEKGRIEDFSGKRSAPRAYGKPFHFSNHPGGRMGKNGDVYDFMLFFNPYIEIFLQEIKTIL